MKKIEFQCGVDMPIVQYKSTVRFIDNHGIEKEQDNKFIMYDYLLDDFYVQHPSFVRRADYSYLNQKAYEVAEAKSKPIINSGYEKYNYMDKVLSVKVENVYPYASGYRFFGELNDDGYKFYFDKMELTAVQVDDEHKEKSAEHFANIIKKLYTIDEFENAIRTVGKFKYTYKYNEFDIAADKYIVPSLLLDNEELCLCKEYYLTLHNPEINLILCNKDLMSYSECGCVLDNTIIADCEESNRYPNEIVYLDGDKLYSLTTCEMSSYVDIFNQDMDLPFLIKKEIIGDEKKIIAMKLLKEVEVQTKPKNIIALSQML